MFSSKTRALWFLLCFAAVRSRGQVEDPGGLRVSAGVGAMRGTTSFEIGGNVRLADGSMGRVHFPISRLEYPLDVVMAVVEASYELGPRWTLGAKLGKNVTTDAGKSNDSDWGILFGPRSLDLYSESDTELEALLLDFNLRYRLLARGNGSFWAGVGYLHQTFDTEDRNLLQSYPSLGAPSDHVAGLNSTYDATYVLPYVEAVAQGRLGQGLALEARLGYAPWARVTDEGHWILRSITFEGDTEGSALLLGLSGRWAFAEPWFLVASLDLATTATDGTATTSSGGVFTHEIDRENESTRTLVALQLGRTL